ncbi:Uncharacterised protein [Vibrio cholerae]|nr:Uncharacterised protein [Vibrio cholerae]CSI26779.1 Uncharacterised protein [Vibrio cholerae]
MLLTDQCIALILFRHVEATTNPTFRQWVNRLFTFIARQLDPCPNQKQSKHV